MTMRLASRRAALPLVPALLLGLAGCSSDSELNSFSNTFMLKMDDAPGFVACRDLALAEAADDAERSAQLLDSAAAAAAAAQSAPIRRTVVPSVEDVQRERVGTTDYGEYEVEAADLRAGCEEVGFNFDLIEEQDLSGTA